MGITNERFIHIGVHMAKKAFDRRSRAGRRNVEIHVSEAELAAMLALAAEWGARQPTKMTSIGPRATTPLGYKAQDWRDFRRPAMQANASYIARPGDSAETYFALAQSAEKKP